MVIIFSIFHLNFSQDCMLTPIARNNCIPNPSPAKFVRIELFQWNYYYTKLIQLIHEKKDNNWNKAIVSYLQYYFCDYIKKWVTQKILYLTD